MKLWERILLVLIALLIILMASGCSSDVEARKQQPLEDVVLAPKTDKVEVPARTLEPCMKLPRMEERAYTQKEALSFVGTLVTPYSDCKGRQKNATDTIKKAFNLSK